MKLLANIDTSRIVNRATVAQLCRMYLEATIAANRLAIRDGRVPPLYQSRVRYQAEPWAGQVEEFADAPTVLARGWGDCDDLAAWRVAELRETGDLGATIKIYWKLHSTNSESVFTIYHAEVRHGDGTVEDPSRLLGM